MVYVSAMRLLVSGRSKMLLLRDEENRCCGFGTGGLYGESRRCGRVLEIRKSKMAGLGEYSDWETYHYLPVP
jgi:hypothetical protein